MPLTSASTCPCRIESSVTTSVAQTRSCRALELTHISSLQVLHETVRSQTAAVWAATNILKLLESLQGEQATQNTPPLDREALIANYAKANKRLLLFDYGPSSPSLHATLKKNSYTILLQTVP